MSPAKTDNLASPCLQEKINEVFLTRQQTANYLQISLPTLHQYTKQGLINSYRIGNKIRYKLTEIEDTMKKRNYGRRA
ncbi:helix-turn-helix domain-containing protein [Gaoshiqia sp. Z1-71]|uniref:helix-turn-helix domain-containing protein n=1 Tax=Gaoshiqia hydrogeniformans TaxID=3290090 RepID=UPI003BF8BB3C